MHTAVTVQGRSADLTQRALHEALPHVFACIGPNITLTQRTAVGLLERCMQYLSFHCAIFSAGNAMAQVSEKCLLCRGTFFDDGKEGFPDTKLPRDSQTFLFYAFVCSQTSCLKIDWVCIMPPPSPFFPTMSNLGQKVGSLDRHADTSLPPTGTQSRAYADSSAKDYY